MADGSQLAQVQCDNYGWVGHPCEHCFDLNRKLKSGRGGGCGGVAQKGRGGRGGKGGGDGKSTPTVGVPPVATPPLTTEATMAAKIEYLKQRLATMANFQHRSHSRGKASTSYGGNDLSYMASVTHIEVSIVVTRGVIRALEPRGATVQLDPQKGEVGKHARLP